ncbi:hypothetical protein G7046_g4460 [Stylonectria norvegica]|nr:hypothetical protein G7046_g4460 [Stylonectria norvegica]
MAFSRLVRFLAKDGKLYYGDAILPKGITDISKAKSARLIKGDIFGSHHVADQVVDIRLLLSPLASDNVATVRCLGLNYVLHAKESGMAIPKFPVLFYKPPTALAGPSDDIPIPQMAQEGVGLDYECELVIVIGSPCANVSEADALNYVFGYAVGNDVSHRDWQIKLGGGQWSLGKGFDGWAPYGPGIVSANTIKDPQTLKIWTKVNGKTVQSADTSDMIFGVRKAISFLSQGTTLMPGDLIFTGTPSGVGMGRKPQTWLKDGDVVEVGIDQVGTCTNTKFPASSACAAIDMTITLPARYRHLMPGTFDAGDFIDFYENPFETLEGLQAAFRDKEPPESWATNNLDVSPDELGDVDWHKYDPPASLRKTPNVTSQILLDIIWPAIDNVKARIAEEDRLKRLEEERSLSDKDATKPGKGKEPYLPIIIAPDKPVQEDAVDEESVKPRASIVSQSGSPFTGAGADATTKPEKRRKFALRRLFQRNTTKGGHPENGESSSAAITREQLQKAYGEDTIDPSQPGVLRDLIQKAYDEQATSSSNPKTKEHASLFDRLNILRAGVAVPDEPVECVSCLDDFQPKDVVKLTCHSYCRECFIRLITASVQNEQQWPPKCCLNEIPFRIILRYVPPNLKKTFQERAQEWEIPISERLYCHQADCGLWVKPKQIRYSKHHGRCDDGHLTCVICRGPDHGTEDCPQDNDMHLTNLLAEEEGWKRCYSCNALVEHREACQHMTCRCGTQFCYVCGLQWRTCGCTMQQLYDLKAAADTRREQRRFNDEVNAQELRAILLQIEELEREEELKAELLRLEQLRLEEERQQRELEEKVRQESIRRRDMELKYQAFREMLDQLHELQQVMVEVDQEEEIKELVVETRTKKEELTEKHEAERAALEDGALAKMAEREAALNKDYQIRAAEEHDVEEAYHEQLRGFWKDKDGGDEEMEAAMVTLRRRMDQGQRAWEKWKAEQLRIRKAKLADERTYREELMYSAEHRMGDMYAEKEAEATRRMVAEKMWLQVVIFERERLLREAEVLEVEGDADSIFAVDSAKNSLEVDV